MDPGVSLFDDYQWVAAGNLVVGDWIQYDGRTALIVQITFTAASDSYDILIRDKRRDATLDLDRTEEVLCLRSRLS